MVTTELSQGWKDLIESINLLAEGANETNYPTNCGHDTLYIASDPSKFSPEQLSRLDELGWIPDTEFGEGFLSFRFGSA